MTKEEFLNTKGIKEGIKVLLVVVASGMVVTIWRNGYDFGQWLYRMLH